MGFFERMLGNLMGGQREDHHGGYQSSRHGGSKHGGYGGYQNHPQVGSPSGGNPGNPCPKCGSANANEARYCNQCGTSLLAIKCSGCGAELSPGTKFCDKCGKPQ